MCDAIYICNTQYTLIKIMDGHLSYLLLILNNKQKSDSFSAHSEKNFNPTKPRTDPRKYMTFKW